MKTVIIDYVCCTLDHEPEHYPIILEYTLVYKAAWKF